MAKPTKLARAKNRVVRLRVMLREAEEQAHALETKEVQQEHYSAQQQYNRLAMRVDVSRLSTHTMIAFLVTTAFVVP